MKLKEQIVTLTRERDSARARADKVDALTAALSELLRSDIETIARDEAESVADDLRLER